MTVYSCIDCPDGNVITTHAYRVERCVKHYGCDNPNRLVAVDILEGQFDIYCVKHYQERVDAGTL